MAKIYWFRRPGGTGVRVSIIMPAYRQALAQGAIFLGGTEIR